MDSGKHIFDSSNVLVFFIRWWKHLVIVGLGGAIAGVIFSSPLFITPQFESRTTMFPSISTSLSRGVIMAWSDFNLFGEVEEAERLLQVLESARVRDRVAERFDLMNHYEIDSLSRFRKTILNNIYRQQVKFRRTQYGAVEVRVRDKDPEMAADMANYVTALVDTVMNEIRRERLTLAHDVAQKEYLEMLMQAELFQDSLKHIMSSGMLDIESQVTMFTRQLAKDLSDRNVQGAQALEQRLQTVGELGGNHIFQSAFLRLITGDLMVLQRRYAEAKADLENFLPFKFDIDEAYPAERKAYPVRWLIVFLMTFGAVVMGVMTLITYESLVEKGILRTKRAA